MGAPGGPPPPPSFPPPPPPPPATRCWGCGPPPTLPDQGRGVNLVRRRRSVRRLVVPRADRSPPPIFSLPTLLSLLPSGSGLPPVACADVVWGFPAPWDCARSCGCELCRVSTRPALPKRRPVPRLLPIARQGSAARAMGYNHTHAAGGVSRPRRSPLPSRARGCLGPVLTSGRRTGGLPPPRSSRAGPPRLPACPFALLGLLAVLPRERGAVP